MAAPSSLSLSYDALLSTTLFNYRKTLADNISQEFIVYYMIKKGGGWTEVSDPGERCQFPLMYEQGSPDSYSGYGQLDTTPMEGITSAFFDYKQASVPIAISGEEEVKNRGEAKIVDLLKSKINQAEMGMKEWWSKAWLQGEAMNDTTSISSARVSPVNGTSFLDPLGLLVKYDPTTSTSIGNINQQTTNKDGVAWWANKTKTSAAATWAAFRQELRGLRNDCAQGVGGYPNLHCTDQITFEVYEQALEAMHQNPSYVKADLPFDNLSHFRGKPLSWDENMIDVETPYNTAATYGTWYMLNTPMLGIKVVKDRNFVNTPFQKPENQDAKVSHILWMGAAGCYNRRKQGVLGKIARTITS